MNELIASEIKDSIFNRVQIRKDTILKWVHSPDTLPLEPLTYLFIEHGDLLTSGAYRTLSNILIEGLLFHAEHVEVNKFNTCPKENELTLYETLECLRLLFCKLWELRHDPDYGLQLNFLKNGIGKLLRGWPDRTPDLVILTILEHILTDGDVRSFFDDFRHDLRISEAFHEACRLANGGSSPK